ncbi:MAG: hypothetical protein AVDCRST_MAG37-732 [uncultured Rubrobacteraceae bacterium]|uniref:Uncharacterized protein n=1 Tax=uncultured Rubrobacteraceae bacterium TaxID=349277 RepID=A0A6J4Q5A0_9ACTN|nr:MAG: hypothetical protein AVDCRST_MAG37-732 [uncultured Rubrobacteraceae bacterium]
MRKEDSLRQDIYVLYETNIAPAFYFYMPVKVIE